MGESFFSFFNSESYTDFEDNILVGVSMNNDISKEKYIHKHFDFVNINIGFESPYNYTTHFEKNMNFTKFAYKITDLLNYYVIPQEKEYLNNFFGHKKIKNIYTISKIIKKKMFPTFINNIIVIKRFEFLLDYITENEFENKYINYINNTLKDLYKGRQYLLQNITKLNRY